MEACTFRFPKEVKVEVWGQVEIENKNKKEIEIEVEVGVEVDYENVGAAARPSSCGFSK